LPVQYKASIVDSYGAVVAKSVNSSLSQSISFSPAPFAIWPPVPIVTASDQSTDTRLHAQVAAGEMNYYLRIEPIPGTDLEQTYLLDLSMEEKIKEPEPLRIFLPAIYRR
jgi:hypothetical protein